MEGERSSGLRSKAQRGRLRIEPSASPVRVKSKGSCLARARPAREKRRPSHLRSVCSVSIQKDIGPDFPWLRLPPSGLVRARNSSRDGALSAHNAPECASTASSRNLRASLSLADPSGVMAMNVSRRSSADGCLSTYWRLSRRSVIRVALLGLTTSARARSTRRSLPSSDLPTLSSA